MKTIFFLFAAMVGVVPLPAAENAGSPFPVQFEAEVPFEPTAFTSDGKVRLVYELALRNFESRPVELQRLRVLDADSPNAAPVATFQASELRTMMQPIGARLQDLSTVNNLAAGGSATVFLMLTLEAGIRTPSHLKHELQTSAGVILTRAIGTQHDVLQTLGPPLVGGAWLAETGLSNDNGHRRGFVVLQGSRVTSRRYAFDWVKVENGEIFKGERQANASYFGFGAPVVAVADGTVAGVTDGVSLNVPGSRPAPPISFETIAGNSVTLDIGKGHFAHYMHLQPGSLRVKVGDHVRRAQVLGLLGNTGDSFVPHLHFEVTNSPKLLSGEGVPYVFDSFFAGNGSTAVMHRKELPMEKMVVEFNH